MTSRLYNIKPAELQSPEVLPLGQNIADESRSETPSTIVALRQAVSAIPEQICPFPKTLPRKSSGRGRKPERCMIVTDTPEKQRIEEEKSKKTKSCPMKRNPKRAGEFSSSSSEDELSKDKVTQRVVWKKKTSHLSFHAKYH
ncbi:hypothetical protein ILUMI_23977 [Ignelater luminosus]|uniref:Uncharacterized protein n=1 Tax=Ignelater luminosus TaxID=2038154 RepID=A0A8K0CBH1_IGNLU|nr:hypothetical protein ILUMI_23977 [Ignelater luminosus]